MHDRAEQGSVTAVAAVAVAVAAAVAAAVVAVAAEVVGIAALHDWRRHGRMSTLLIHRE
jgi:hypothetical protein